MPDTPETFKCPICKKQVGLPVPGEKTGVFPFCSERCKLVDLGRWLDGAYQIPVQEQPETSEEEDDLTDTDRSS